MSYRRASACFNSASPWTWAAGAAGTAVALVLAWEGAHVYVSLMMR